VIQEAQLIGSKRILIIIKGSRFAVVVLVAAGALVVLLPILLAAEVLLVAVEVVEEVER
jgi:hypothetical protein